MTDYPELPSNYAWETHHAKGEPEHVLLFFDPCGPERENYGDVDMEAKEIRVWGKGTHNLRAYPVESLEEGLKILAMRAWLGEWE